MKFELSLSITFMAFYDCVQTLKKKRKNQFHKKTSYEVLKLYICLETHRNGICQRRPQEQHRESCTVLTADRIHDLMKHRLK